MFNRHICRKVFTAAVIVLAIWGGIVVSAKVRAAEPELPERIYSAVKIEAGDTLWSIAETYCSYCSVTEYIEELRYINDIYDERALIPGNSIIVYNY